MSVEELQKKIDLLEKSMNKIEEDKVKLREYRRLYYINYRENNREEFNKKQRIYYSKNKKYVRTRSKTT